MRHCRGDAPGLIRTPPCWRAAAARPRSGNPRPASTRMTRTYHNPTARECRGGLPPGQTASGSQGVVRTVAEWLAAGRLAPAEPNLLGSLGGERDRGQPGPLMRAVAEGLRGAAPARTPEVSLAGLDIDAIGLFLRGYRTFHTFSPGSALASVIVLGGGSPLPGLYASRAEQTSRRGPAVGAGFR